MLLFWISAGLLTVVAVLAIVRPLAHAVGSGPAGGEVAGALDASDADVAVYRQQLEEVDTDLARGLVTEAEAESARIEIARRLLNRAEAAQSDTAEATPGAVGARKMRERAFVVLTAAIPAVAMAFYLAQGSPNLPGMPAAERLAQAPSANADVEELVARVEARLRANPADGLGWDVIAPVYLRLERFRDAADSYRRAITILGQSVPRLGGLAESLVLSNDGIVTEEARAAYVRVLELDADRVEARFGLALAMEQDGDLEGAKRSYEQMLEKAPPRAPWRAFVAERLESLDKKQPQAEPAKPGAEARSPEAQIAALPEGERRQMILQMVDGLAKRLATDGRDLDGWQRLLRSWMVLGEPRKAEAALLDARKALAEDAKALGEINAFAKTLGLKS